MDASICFLSSSTCSKQPVEESQVGEKIKSKGERFSIKHWVESFTDNGILLKSGQGIPSKTAVVTACELAYSRPAVMIHCLIFSQTLARVSNLEKPYTTQHAANPQN